VDAAHQLAVHGPVRGEQCVEVTRHVRLGLAGQQRPDDQGGVRAHRRAVDVARQRPAAHPVTGQRAGPGRVELGRQQDAVLAGVGAGPDRARWRAVDQVQRQAAGEATGAGQPDHDRVGRAGGEDLHPRLAELVPPAQHDQAGGRVDAALELGARAAGAHGERRGADQGIDPDRLRVRGFAGRRVRAHLLRGLGVLPLIEQLPQARQDRRGVRRRQGSPQRQEQPFVRDGQADLGRGAPAQRALPAVAGHQRVLPIDSVPHRP
jgi:hypothetical protein